MTAAARSSYAVPIGDIVAGLAADILAVCGELLPGGRRERDEWVVPGNQSPFGCSLGVHLRGAKAGVWGAWSAGEGGDALDLVARVQCGGDKKAAVRWALSWLDLATHEATGASSVAHALPAAAPGNARHDSAERTDTGGSAFRLYLACQKQIKGTPAEAYLRGRGIDLAVLGRQPRALRFHPELYNAESGRAWPALVAGIWRGKRTVAVHRTWLTADGNKAPLANPKMTLGSYKGGLIPLWRGAQPDGRPGRPLAEALPGAAIVISEGIEDGLSCAVAAPQYRVAAAVSLANLGALDLPPAIATVLIAAQNDPWWHEVQGRDHPTRQGLDKAIRRFQAQGRQVRLIRPEAGKDVNDLLRGIG